MDVYPVPFASLSQAHSDAIRHPSARSRVEMGFALRDFLEGNWKTLGYSVRSQLDELDPMDLGVILSVKKEFEQRAEAILPRDQYDTARLNRFGLSVSQLANMASEHAFAMRVAGEPEPRVELARAILIEIVENVRLAGRVQQLAAGTNKGVEELAPLVMVGILHAEDRRDPDGLRDLNGLLSDQADVLARSPFSGDETRKIITGLADNVLEGRSEIEVGMKQVDAMSARHINGALEALPDYMKSLPLEYRKRLVGADVPDPVRIDVSPLVAFQASSYVGSPGGRVEGTRELVESLITVNRMKEGREGVEYTRAEDLHAALLGFRHLTHVMEEERSTHREVSGKWQQVEKDMEFAKRRDPTMKEYPLPDDMSALDARSLYIHNATERGVPLGVILQEIYDSPHLTYGPTERQYFTRLAFYGARKYAANFAIHEDWISFRLQGRNPIRVEEIRDYMREIEVELRAKRHLSDEELRTIGNSRINRLLDERAITDYEAFALTDKEKSLPKAKVRDGTLAEVDNYAIVDSMMARIRAGQEVLYLTAHMAIHGEITTDLLHQYTEFPHTRHFAMSDDPHTHQGAMLARNGQRLLELDVETRTRWRRYRQRSAPGVDVRTLDVPGAREMVVPDLDDFPRDQQQRRWKPKDSRGPWSGGRRRR